MNPPLKIVPGGGGANLSDDPEMIAMWAAYRALRTLPHVSRARALKWVSSRLSNDTPRYNPDDLIDEIPF